MIFSLCTAMPFQFIQKFIPISKTLIIKNAAALAFHAEPHTITIHHAANSGESQSVVAQRLAVTRATNVNRFRRERYDLSGRLAQRRARWFAEFFRLLCPKLIAAERANGR